jgi:hypothetical protein
MRTGSKALLPFGQLPARFDQNPATEEDDEVASLGDGNELVRRDEPAFGMIPANKRLETAEVTVAGRDNWLVVDDELLRIDGFAQTCFNLEAGNDLLA